MPARTMPTSMPVLVSLPPPPPLTEGELLLLLAEGERGLERNTPPVIGCWSTYKKGAGQGHGGEPEH